MPDWRALLVPLAPVILGYFAKWLGARTGGVRRRLDGHLALRARLREGGVENLAPVQVLIDEEVAALVLRERRRLHRQLDGGTAAAVVFIVLLTALPCWALWQWGYWWAQGLSILWGIIGFLFVLVGAPQVFKYPGLTDPPDPAASPPGDAGRTTP